MNAIQAPANQGPLPRVLAESEGNDEPHRPRWQRWLLAESFDRGFILCFTLLLCHSLSRTLRLPNGYAKGHWFHNYKHGFVPRGLVGEILYPIFQNKNTEELNGLLAFFGWGVLLVLCVGVAFSAHKVVARQSRIVPRVLFGAAFLVFANSPYMVMSGHLSGYFDHLVQLAGLLAVFAVVKDRAWIAGVLCTFSILTHEMFVVTVMPAVFFALLLQLRGKSGAHMAKSLSVFLVPPVIAALAVLLSGAGTQDVSALTRDIARYGVVGNPGMSTVHLSQGFSAILGDMIGSTLGRLLAPDGLASMGPALAFLIAAGLLLPKGTMRWPMRVVYTLICMTPLLMLLTVWDGDTGRMASMTAFCAFCSLVALGLTGKRHSGFDAPEQLNALRLWLLGIFSALGLALVGWQIEHRTDLMDHETDGESMFSLRVAATVEGYHCGQLLFKNSNFEEGSLRGWRLQGMAFVQQPVDRQPAHWGRRPWNERQYWVGTYDRRSNGGPSIVQGDGPRGELHSQSFIVVRPKMTFLVGGGNHPSLTYVSLWVEGKERFRVTGRNETKMRAVSWDLSQYIGHSAEIRIVDRSNGVWGHIMADGFCYQD